MKVAYLTAGRIPSRAANAVGSVRICESMALLGHDVALFARRGDGEAEDVFARYGVQRAFRVVLMADAAPHGLRTARVLAGLNRQLAAGGAPDGVIARDPLLMTAALRFRLPFVFDAHGIPEPGNWRALLFARLFRSPRFRRLLCITSRLREEYLERFPVLRAEHVIVAANGAEDMGVPAEPLPVWPGRSEALQVGYVGGAYRGRGIETLLEAARIRPDVDFHIVGAVRADVDWVIEEAPANVHFHGYVPHGRLAGYYRRFDVLAAPYGSEVFHSGGGNSARYASPLKIFEYMSAGLPIVASALNGVSEVLQDGRNALLTSPGDGEGFTAALARLAGNAKLRRRLGTEARADYLAAFTWRSRAELMVSCLAGPC